jgi:RNA polymerase sigma-70 factor (ECF subfamily)
LRRLPAPTSGSLDPLLSFETLCRAHADQIARWAARLGGPGLEPDEAVQEVFLIVARRLGEFRGDAKITTWLFRITVRVVANQRRALRRRQGWARLTRRIVDQTATDDPGPAAQMERAEATRRFYRALDELPERLRQVLVLFELEDMGTAEIADLFERPATTVRVWLHRARRGFIDAWRRHQVLEDQE